MKIWIESTHKCLFLFRCICIYLPLARRKDFQYFERVQNTISLHSLLRKGRAARSWKSEAHSTCPTPTKEPCERKALNDSAEGKGPMYLHDPRSADLTPRHLRAEPISTDPLADVSATTQNGIDTCANLWVSSGNPRNSNGTTCHSITGFPCNIGSWVTVHPRVSQNTGLRTPGPPLPPDRKAIDGTILFELKASGIRRHCIWFQTLHLVSPHKALRIIGSTFPFGVPNGTQKVTLASQSQPVFQRDEPWCIVWHCTNN